MAAMDSAAAAGEGQRFKRIPRQSLAGNLELDPLVCFALIFCSPACGAVHLVVRMWVRCVLSYQEWWWYRRQCGACEPGDVWNAVKRARSRSQYLSFYCLYFLSVLIVR